jgi:hypothetical protein
MPARSKHSSLLRTFVNYERKKFYSVDTWRQPIGGLEATRIKKSEINEINWLSIWENKSLNLTCGINYLKNYSHNASSLSTVLLMPRPIYFLFVFVSQESILFAFHKICFIFTSSHFFKIRQNILIDLRPNLRFSIFLMKILDQRHNLLERRTTKIVW